MPPLLSSVDLKSAFGAEFIRLWKTLPLDVCTELLCHFTLLELENLSITEKFGDCARRELRSRLDVLFKEWGLDLDATLKFMEDTHSIMSGSGVLYVSKPGDWDPGDFDFYTPRGQKDAATDFFEPYGYRIVPKDPASVMVPAAGVPVTEEYSHDLLRDVITMRRGTDGPKLNVIESAVSSAEAPVLLFHSTEVMNIFTSTGVACLFPQWTLKGLGVVNHPSGRGEWIRNKTRETAVLDKYRARGYKIVEKCGDLHEPGVTSCVICREEWTVWDQNILSMPLRRGDVVAPAVDLLQWRLGSHVYEYVRQRGIGWYEQEGAYVAVQGRDDDTPLLYRGLGKTLHPVSVGLLDSFF